MSSTIIDFLKEQAGGHISFHMPGHKGRSAIYERTGYGGFLANIMECDITEIPGADALFCPETTIREVMNNYADLYSVLHTELLVNGSSAGVMAAVISSVPVGGKIIMARNSHHSAFSALRLGGINPVYLRPEPYTRSGLPGGISPAELEQACAANPDASAVLITSPNYYGMLSDIAQLAIVAHEYGMVLIVDQAHGAHLRFFDKEAERLRNEGVYIRHLNHSAEALGADIVVNSTHKTLLSFTGTGILNICSGRVDIPRISETLRMLQTTSPSYILMGSLDINEKIMREYGARIAMRWREDLSLFYRRAARVTGLTVIGGPEFTLYNERAGLDMTKINISMADLGLNGEQLDRELRRKGFISEMVHGDYVMLMTGAGSMSSDYEKLLEALKDISGSYGVGALHRRAQLSTPEFDLEMAEVPFDYEEIPLYEADGRVLYDPVIIYPPGSPVACPGEIMTLEAITYISQAIERGDKVSGVDEEGCLKAGREAV